VLAAIDQPRGAASPPPPRSRIVDACVQARMATRTDRAALTLGFDKMSLAPGLRRRLVGRA
jgi:hypothetical protein